MFFHSLRTMAQFPSRDHRPWLCWTRILCWSETGMRGPDYGCLQYLSDGGPSSRDLSTSSCAWRSVWVVNASYSRAFHSRHRGPSQACLNHWICTYPWVHDCWLGARVDTLFLYWSISEDMMATGNPSRQPLTEEWAHRILRRTWAQSPPWETRFVPRIYEAFAVLRTWLDLDSHSCHTTPSYSLCLLALSRIL